MAAPRLEDCQSFLLDEDGNFTIETDENGFQSLTMVNGIEYVGQSCRVRMQTVLGESVYHPEMGLPMPAIERVFDETFTRGAIGRCLSIDPDIKDVPSIDLVMHGDVRGLEVSVAVIARDNQEAQVEVAL